MTRYLKQTRLIFLSQRCSYGFIDEPYCNSSKIPCSVISREFGHVHCTFTSFISIICSRRTYISDNGLAIVKDSHKRKSCHDLHRNHYESFPISMRISNPIHKGIAAFFLLSCTLFVEKTLIGQILVSETNPRDKFHVRL